jgi:hypothetical protein
MAARRRRPETEDAGRMRNGRTTVIPDLYDAKSDGHATQWRRFWFKPHSRAKKCYGRVNQRRFAEEHHDAQGEKH